MVHGSWSMSRILELKVKGKRASVDSLAMSETRPCIWVQGLGLGVRVQGPGFRVQGCSLGVRVQGLGVSSGATFVFWVVG